MGVTSEHKVKKEICAALLAHVDAGKTTLSEGLLYTAGSIRKMGKVDTKDAFFDTNEMERARGITIFSKQASLVWKDTKVTILDTPGHVDFSAEMERVLQVLDYAILVISGADGVQGHTRTLWMLLEKYQIPTFLFVNKMDQPGTDRGQLMTELKSRLDDGCVDFSDTASAEFMENIATCDEAALEQFLDTEQVETKQIREMIVQRKLFPCFFGAALKSTGVEEFLDGFAEFTLEPSYPEAFGAKVFKISRDEQGNRLTHLKVTGGTLKVKELLTNAGHGEAHEIWEEKVNQIRIYSGEKFETPAKVSAGSICAVTGLTKTYPGEALGAEAKSQPPVLEPVLTCKLILPDGCDAAVMLPKLKLLEEEQPELHIVWDEQLQEIQAQIMGEVQTEILKSLIAQRFGALVTFGPANIVYRETIANAVEGVGHFEPLRHYAEVHLLMEPLEQGSGLVFAADCSEDMLDKNWQRLILTHLAEREHRGVLTGAAITDMKITLIAGRAHQKHTEGGDFRQATYRAVRQGLMEAESVLLEPYYNFRLEVPESMIGRAMTDVEKMNGVFEPPFTEGEFAVLTGYGPVVTMQDYQKEVAAYSRGFGRIFFSLRGYEPCHNASEVIAACGYDAQGDLEYPTGSVFCAHGAGFVVPWDEVKDYMHVESPLVVRYEEDMQKTLPYRSVEEEWIGTDEVDAIIEKTFFANSRGKSPSTKGWKRKSQEYTAPVSRTYAPKEKKEEYLLVDGYNIIHAWDDLHELAMENMDAARGKLMDELCNYQGMKKINLIVVFDAYRVVGHETECMDYHNIHVVYTKEAETADQYIEKFAHNHADKYQVTVATSDGLEQIIIRGEGCRLLSARDFKYEMEQASMDLRAKYIENQTVSKYRPFEKAMEEKS
jgi:small GTP-binding protein